MKTTNIPQSTTSGTGSGSGSPIRLVEATGIYQEPLIVCTCGEWGSGKSRLIGTARNLALMPMDAKSKGTITRTCEQLGYPMPLLPNQDMIRVSNPMLLSRLPNTCIVIGDAKHKGMTPGQLQDEMQDIADTIKIDSPSPICCRRHFFRWHVERVKYAVFLMAADPRVKTIGIDPFGQFVEDVSYANYGLTGVIDPKEFGFAPRQDMNTEIRQFLNAINHKNLILTHHIKQVWKDGKPTNKYKPESQFSGIGYYANIMVEQSCDESKPEGEGRYMLRVNDCQANASLIGLDLLSDEGITFTNLAECVFPDAPDGYFD